MKRSGKWYRNNEKSVMKMLGLKPTPNSGSGWLVKEDGQNENVLCQLKSTDAHSIKIQLQDLQTLEYNAGVAHKLPLFAIQFIQDGQVYCLVKPEDLPAMARYIESGVVQSNEQIVDYQEQKIQQRRVIKSSDSARQAFRNEEQNKYNKKVRSAT